MKNYTVLSLFSGAGGMSLGFKRAGIQPSIAFDINADAIASYSNNLGIESHIVDLANTNSLLKSKLLGLTDVLAIIGGPPCQGFSSAGAKNRKDSRNNLIFNYLRIVHEVRPKWFLFENVEGLLTSNKSNGIYDLIREFIKTGYSVRLEKINFAAYGLPQARKRVILMGNRVGLDFEFPSATHSYNAGKHKSLNALPLAPSFDVAVAGLGEVTSDSFMLSPYISRNSLNPYDEFMRENNASNGVTLHYVRSNKLYEAIYSKLLPGQTMRDLPMEYWHRSYKRRAFRRVQDGTPTERRGGAPCGVKRLIGDLNSLTITSASTRDFIHPRENRAITLREAARLQSFPDYFQFVGTTSSISRQIGNAFPPLVANIFAKHIMNLDGLAGGHSNFKNRSPGLIGYKLTESSGASPALRQTQKLLNMLCQSQQLLPFDEAFTL